MKAGRPRREYDPAALQRVRTALVRLQAALLQFQEALDDARRAGVSLRDLEHATGISRSSLSRNRVLAFNVPALQQGQSGSPREDVFAAIREALAVLPAQRVCQVVVNATGVDDPFYVEDAELAAALRDYARNYAPGRSVDTGKKNGDA